MNVDGIEVSSFCSEWALFEYVIKREYVFTEKCLILACAVTYATDNQQCDRPVTISIYDHTSNNQHVKMLDGKRTRRLN